jgi:RHS repeat-associated protein
MGSGVPVGGECIVFDYDDDGDVDLVDYGQFELLYGTQPAAQIAYDFRNQMATYSEWIDGSVDKVHEYYYDALGRRIAKIVDAGGTPEETRYYYVGWRVVEEQDDSGDTLATYVYGNYIDEVLQMRRDVDGTGGPEDYYYLHDDMHNVMALTDATGTVVERYQYDDYGQPTYSDGSFAPLGSAASAYDNPYLFTGRRFDNETGWYYYRTRYLDPFTGRFTTRDTIGIWGDSYNVGNGFSYVGNNPWSWMDPLGLNSGKLVIFVDQPGNMDGSHYDFYLGGGKVGVGHTYGALVLYDDDENIVDGPHYFGFYPLADEGDSTILFQEEYEGFLADDEGHDWDVRMEYEISAEEYEDGMTVVDEWADDTPTWDRDDRHCLHFILTVAEEAGQDFDTDEFSHEDIFYDGTISSGSFGYWLSRQEGSVENIANAKPSSPKGPVAECGDVGSVDLPLGG